MLLWRLSTKRMAAGQKADVTGHVWDENLEEYNNPLPRWWMWLFYITIVFALVYLVLYPGLGSFAGVLQVDLASASTRTRWRRPSAKYEPIYAKYAAMDIPDGGRGPAGARDRAAPVPELLRPVPRARMRAAAAAFPT